MKPSRHGKGREEPLSAPVASSPPQPRPRGGGLGRGAGAKGPRGEQPRGPTLPAPTPAEPGPGGVNPRRTGSSGKSKLDGTVSRGFVVLTSSRPRPWQQILAGSGRRGAASDGTPLSPAAPFAVPPWVSSRGPGRTDFLSSAIGATVGVGVALVGIPAGICALGFTGAGIAAGSVAAKMMSAAAIANNGAVAAGSTVAVLQSIGAAGLSLGAKVGLTSAMGSLGAVIGGQLFDGGDGSE
ncbi:uncharacterized protein VSU04_013379 isoform 1-T1 [Chlamydotis macqueenii]